MNQYLDNTVFTQEDKYRDLFSGFETKAGLKRKALRGGTAVMGAEIIGQILRIGSTMVLARLLIPEDFGLLAMVTALTVFAERFKDLGLSDATVQSKEISHAQVSRLFWINLGVCIGIALVVSSLSKTIAWFYNDQRLVGVSLVIASTFLFSGLVIQHQAILRRRLSFGVISMIGLCSSAFSILLAIMMAFHGFGYWALVAREFSRALFVCIGTWLACPWVPGLPTRSAPIAHLLSFARNVTGFNLVYFFSQSVDKILLGKLQGPYWVGLYTNAFQLLALPVNQLQHPLITVGLPALSTLQADPVAFRSSFEKMAQLLTFFTMPVILFLALFGDVIVVLLLGGKWLNAIPIFQVLAAGAFVEPVVHTTGLAMVACGKTAEYFRLGLVNAISLLCCLAVGSFWGVMGITAGYAFSIYLALAVCLAYGLPKTPVQVLPLLRRLAPNFFCSLAVAMFFLYVRHVVGWNFSPPWIAVFFVAAAGAYLGLWMVIPGGKSTMRAYWDYAGKVISNRKG
ncbi:MAG: Teichuronic acid biosynthesis protein TuaB [Syntrophus sp. PtaB.Bin138]|nr:MAG: Teichuronic acid biosynthesis protein TuaB [Syntrophus sp. PtaB.Bin138]